MIKCVYLFTVLFISLSTYSQSPSLKVVNDTDIMMYAYLIEIDENCVSITHNVAIAPNSVEIVPSKLKGGSFEKAIITDTVSPYDYNYYYMKTIAPWANCFKTNMAIAKGVIRCKKSKRIKSTFNHPFSSVNQPYLFIFD